VLLLDPMFATGMTTSRLVPRPAHVAIRLTQSYRWLRNHGCPSSQGPRRARGTYPVPQLDCQPRRRQELFCQVPSLEGRNSFH
jgi:hypothetical protein